MGGAMMRTPSSWSASILEKLFSLDVVRVHEAVEEDGLAAKRGLVLDPVANVLDEERLRKDLTGIDAGMLVLVDELLPRNLVCTVQPRREEFDFFQFGRELGTEFREQFGWSPGDS